MRWMPMLLLFACSPATPESTNDSGDEDTDEVLVETVTGDSTTHRRREPGECPARYRNADAPSCGEGDHPSSCQYERGHCYCGTPMHCGGAAPEPMPPRWICEEHRTPCAAAGTPCDQVGAQCATHPCGWSGVQCIDGTWQAYRHAGPP